MNKSLKYSLPVATFIAASTAGVALGQGCTILNGYGTPYGSPVLSGDCGGGSVSCLGQSCSQGPNLWEQYCAPNNLTNLCNSGS